jgi:hypothetical protein
MRHFSICFVAKGLPALPALPVPGLYTSGSSAAASWSPAAARLNTESLTCKLTCVVGLFGLCDAGHPGLQLLCLLSSVARDAVVVPCAGPTVVPVPFPIDTCSAAGSSRASSFATLVDLRCFALDRGGNDASCFGFHGVGFEKNTEKCCLDSQERCRFKQKGTTRKEINLVSERYSRTRHLLYADR